jgi:hypothetical protein
MSYRNPGQLVTRYNPSEVPTGSSSVARPNYNEIARNNAKANFEIVRKNDIAAQKAFADMSKIVKETPYVNQASANNVLSTSIDEYAAAKSRLETATGFYEKKDSVTGDVIYSYDSDLKTLANNQAFLNGFTQDLNAINYMTDAFNDAGGFGKGEGQVDPMFTSPYFTLLRSVQDPFTEGVNVEYIKEKDANGIPSLGIKLYGSRVAEVNKIQGNDGDSYVIRPGELQKIFNNQDGDPQFEGLFYKNHTAVGNIKKQAESTGMINPKTGLISKEYMVDGGVTTKTNTIGGYTEQISTSFVNKDKVDQMLNPMIITQANSVMRRGNTSTDVAINQYTQQDADGNYYYNPVVWDDVNNKFSIDKENIVNLGKDFFDRNLTEENQKTFGYTQEQYNHIVEILKSNAYQNLGLTQQSQQTIIPNTRKSIPKQPKPTAGEIAKQEKIDLIQAVREDIEAIITDGRKSNPADIKEGFGQLIDGKIIGSIGYDPLTGIVELKAPESVEGVEKRVLQFDINNLDQYSQRLNNLFKTGKVFEGASLGKTDPFSDLAGFAGSKEFDIKDIDEEDLVKVINSMPIERGFRKLMNDAGYEKVDTSGKLRGDDEIVLIPKKDSGKKEIRITSANEDFEGALKVAIQTLQPSSSNTSTNGAASFNKDQKK